MRAIVFPGAGRSTRPTICRYSAVERVGRARMQHSSSGQSNPSVSTLQLHTTRVSPERSRASTASRSAVGISPSMCSAATPAARKASTISLLCSTFSAKSTVRALPAWSSHSETTSPTTRFDGGAPCRSPRRSRRPSTRAVLVSIPSYSQPPTGTRKPSSRSSRGVRPRTCASNTSARPRPSSRQGVAVTPSTFAFGNQLEELGVRVRRRDVVALVDDDQVHPGELARASHQRLHSSRPGPGDGAPSGSRPG
jgi:hypothetical protein